MKYKNIESYLEENNNFNNPNNELWLVDNIAIKSFEIKKLLPNHFHPKILDVNDVKQILSEFVDIKDKKIINSFEKKILINKIINEPKYKDNFTLISSNIDDLVNCVDSILSFPSYEKRYSSVIKNDNNSGLFLLKDKVDLLVKLYLEACNDNNLIDEIQINNLSLDMETPKIFNFDKIVIYGEFFYIPENLMNLLVKFVELNGKEIVFVSSISNNIEQFFKDKDFISYQNRLSEFLYSDKEESISSRLKSFDSNKIELWKFADWNDELNYIAREIKKDVLNNKININDVAVYIPNNDLYFFKVRKIFNDFDLPISTSYADTLSQHPLGTFTKWYLNADLSDTSNFLKLLKSPFTSIKYEEFTSKKDIKVSFMDKELNTSSVTVDYFNLDLIEKVLLESGIDNLDLEENNYKKLHNYYQRKVHYEAKRGSFDNTSKIENEFLKSYIHFIYFNDKYKEISSFIPKKALVRDIKTSILNAYDYFNISKRYTNYEKEEGIYELPYKRLKDVLDSIVEAIEKIDNRKYELLEFTNLFLDCAESSFVSEIKDNVGVFVTELPFLSKMSFKRIYQVGMTNKYYPTQSSKSIFHRLVSKFKPIETRDTQLFNFTELLHKSKTQNDFELRLCYPLVLNNQEDEESEVFLDIVPYLSPEKQKFLPKRYELEEMIYSNTDKALAVSKNQYDMNINKILDHVDKRDDIYNLSEYEGYLNQDNENILKNATSITKIEEYALCPMKYWFDVELGLKANKKAKKDLDSGLKGTLIHKILEEYYTESTKRNLFRDTPEGLLCLESRNLMLEIANTNFKTYEESLNNIYIDKIKEIFISGLDDFNAKKLGILVQILMIDQERILEGKIPSKFEYNFTSEIEGLTFKGIIDRVDEYIDNEFFDVLDYKTGKIDHSQKSKEIRDGLSFQLPVYAMSYSNDSNKSIKEGLYYSLKQDNFKEKILAKPSLNSKFEVKEDESDKSNKFTVEEILEENKKHLKKIKESICNSDYTYTKLEQDKACKYCDYKNICRYDSDKAEYHFSEKKELEILSLDFINKDMFYFPDQNEKFSSGLTESQNKALEHDRNIIVTAGAGAGKTETLTKRMEKLLSATKGDIEKILVITFTKKATAEMQNRIYKSLIKSSNDINNPEVEYIKKAKLNFKNNWISTMDSFYLRILQENALELGLNYDTNIAEDKDLLELKADTIEKTIDDLALQKDPLLNRLLESWSRERLIEVFNTLINWERIDLYIKSSMEDIREKYISFYLKQADLILNNLDLIEQNALNCLERNKEILKFKDAFVTIKEIIEFYRTNLIKFISDPLSFKFDFDSNELIKMLKFPTKPKNQEDFYEEIKPELIFTVSKKCITGYFLSCLDNLDLELNQLEVLLKVLKVIQEKYLKTKEERNIYTFSDISTKLYHLLKTNPDIRKKLTTKFDFIMLDEFQDTNLAQYEIAKYLAGWDGENLESIDKNKLFFVGDEKQSIYLFRGGDVQVFNNAKEEVSKINELNSLERDNIIFEDNFRSSEDLVSFFNRFFRHVFKPYYDEKKIYEAEHQDLKAHKKAGSINFFLVNRGFLREKSLRKNQYLESKLVASTVKKILEFNPKEEIAILFRTAKRINSFANALEQAGVNYIIYGGRGFYQNQEILDIMHILKFLSDKNRVLELVGFLRSSFIALSDREINDLKPNILRTLKEKYQELYNQIFGSFEDNNLVKKGWRQLTCDLKVHELIEKIIHDTFVKAPIFKGKGSSQKIKNLERFIEIAKENMDLTLEEFIEFIDFQIENKIEESNATVLEVGEEKPVQLMTIHKSKGLGFDTVILADTAGESFKEHFEDMHLDDLEFLYDDEIAKDFIGLKIKDYFIEYNSFSKDLILEHIKSKNSSELKRLLYVAMTRAKHNLIVTASCWDGLDTLKKIKSISDVSNFMKIINDYFKFTREDDAGDKLERKLEDLVVLEDNYIGVESDDNIPFYIINANSDITLTKDNSSSNKIKCELSDEVSTNKQTIYSYSSLKKNPDKIKEIIKDSKDINVISYPVNGLKKISYPYNLNKDEKEKALQDRGVVIHKLLEYDLSSEDFINNILKNNIKNELLEDSLDHYNNIKIIVNEISKDIIEEFNELSFLNTNITGIFDKLVKTKDGWEILDYKISEFSNPESIVEEVKNEYKLQFDIYYQQLAQLLKTNNIKYKVIFSNFGYVELYPQPLTNKELYT